MELTSTLATTQVDNLLQRVGEKLQISPTAYTQAESRYNAIADWLRGESSPLTIYNPTIFPQGSLRIGTTVKPVGHNEYDLDLVCLFTANPEIFPNPVELLNIVERRLRSNGIYKDMTERKNRCIRINYANEFHMDILPACPNPSNGLFGTNCVLVPDRNAQNWKHSNPKGYAQWFENTALESAVKYRKRIEPVPEQNACEDLAALKRAVQLIKRYRDISLAHLPEKRRPISIVLTTLAAHCYRGQSSVFDTVSGILDGIVSSIPDVTQGRLLVRNPTNKQEDLSERWDDDPEAYLIFVDWVREFRALWKDLALKPGLHNTKTVFEKIFGERIANEVIEGYLKSYEEPRRSESLAVERGSGTIVSVSVPLSVPIKQNTFFGSE